MSVHHKFIKTDFGNGFQTHNAILNTTPYKPEVLIVGTFNPDTPNANFADFFYGRNYFWPGLKNLFNNNVDLLDRRMPPNGMPIHDLNPTIEEIFSLCDHFKLAFADLIIEVLHECNDEYNLLPNDNVEFQGNIYNLIQDSNQNGIQGLAQLNQIGQVHWNTQNIIKYLCNNPQINDIFLTRQPNGVWEAQWDMIINHDCMIGRNCTNIFTPSGQGLPGQPRMTALLHHWIHNNADNFGNLNHAWLQDKGVYTNNF